MFYYTIPYILLCRAAVYSCLVLSFCDSKNVHSISHFNYLQVCNLVAWNPFTLWNGYYHYLYTKIFSSSPIWKSISINNNSRVSLLFALGSMYATVTLNLLVFCKSWIIQYYPTMIGFFFLAKGLPLLQNTAIVHSFLWLDNVSLNLHTTYHLCVPLLMGTWQGSFDFYE